MQKTGTGSKRECDAELCGEMSINRSTIGMGVKSKKKSSNTKNPSARRFPSSGVISSNGCVRTFPSQNKINTHNNQLKLNAPSEKVNRTGKKLSAINTPMAMGKILRAFSPNKPYATCPPSSVPTGTRLSAVTSNPAQPANATVVKLHIQSVEWNRLTCKEISQPIEQQAISPLMLTGSGSNFPKTTYLENK